MDRDVDTLTMLLMDPFLTRDEAEREAAASAPAAWGRNEPSVFEADPESGDR